MAVMQTYEFAKGSEAYKSEAACIVRLSYKRIFPIAAQVPSVLYH